MHEPPHSVRSPVRAFASGGRSRRHICCLRHRARNRRPRVGRLATSGQAVAPPCRLRLYRHGRPCVEANGTTLRRLEELPPRGRRPHPGLHVPRPPLWALVPLRRPRDQPRGPGLSVGHDQRPDAAVPARARRWAARLHPRSGPVRERRRRRRPQHVRRDLGRGRAHDLRLRVAPLRLHGLALHPRSRGLVLHVPRLGRGRRLAPPRARDRDQRRWLRRGDLGGHRGRRHGAAPLRRLRHRPRRLRHLRRPPARAPAPTSGTRRARAHRSSSTSERARTPVAASPTATGTSSVPPSSGRSRRPSSARARACATAST